MAAEKVEAREATWRQLFPWTELFKAFQVALDLNKLLLAAGGILTTAFVWWLLSLIFTANESTKPPDYPLKSHPADLTEDQKWVLFRTERQRWNLVNEAAGLDRSSTPVEYTIEDIAETRDEYETVKKLDLPRGSAAVDAINAHIAAAEKAGKLTEAERRLKVRAPQYAKLGQAKPAGRLAVSPWSEDRGPNPFLLVTGQVGIPWEPGHFWEWFIRDQVPVMIEPLVKLARPVMYFLSPRNDGYTRLYFFMVSIFTLLIWSVVGGAITRIAVVQLTRNERPGLWDSLRFTLRFFLSYVFAPLFPIGFILFLTVLMTIFGLLHMIPFFGDIFVSGLLWFIPLLFGLVIAMALVGLIAWPLMPVTVSAEGTDSWEAVSRSYSYLYQRPWMCAWYSLIALFYGGIVVFFIGFMGSLTVYMAKWAVNRTPFIQSAGRETNFLFVYAPTSFGWRELLLEGTQIEPTREQMRDDKDLEALNGADVVVSRDSRPVGAGQVGGLSRWNRIDQEHYRAYLKTLRGWNLFGAYMVSFWLGLAFLLVLGFGYSFFWTAATIIYLLLRKSVDLNEMDEVYVEEDDYESRFTMPPPTVTPPPQSQPAKPSATLPMVEPPRTPASPAPAPSPAPTPTPAPAPAPVAPVTPKATEPTEPVSEAPAAPPVKPVEKSDDDVPPAM